jgi:hypothetical protein
MITYSSEISNFMFTYCEGEEDIKIYKSGDSSPLCYISNVSTSLDEKDFHYEIMDWYGKNS